MVSREPVNDYMYEPIIVFIQRDNEYGGRKKPERS